ncbi:MAG TPA: DUF4230 domain-containing protein [Gemmatimonadales bacterium]|nr:DUF4230 domain-containing protein [Gemmatimonadales bacterium]
MPLVAGEEGRDVRRVMPGLLAIVALGVFLWLAGRETDLAAGLLPGRSSTTLDHGVVVERTRAVARLVTSETTLRDVVVYENRLLGSTKRSLVVVTGKVLSGFDLDRGTEVRVDHEAKVVHVVLPPAGVLGVEVTELKTYDEQRGLWNPFRPADRDAIFRLARDQLVRSAGEVELARHTEESARRLLDALISVDGYTTEVTFADHPQPPRARPEPLD